MILDPALVVDEVEEYWPFETGLQNDVFIKWPNDTVSPDYNYTNSSLMIGYVGLLLLNLFISINIDYIIISVLARW